MTKHLFISLSALAFLTAHTAQAANTVTIVQSTTGQTAVVSQQGGDGNSFSVDQRQNRNNLNGSQNGNRNQANVFQNGTLNRAVAAETGNDHIININQSGTPTGTGNLASAWNSSATANITGGTRNRIDIKQVAYGNTAGAQVTGNNNTVYVEQTQTAGNTTTRGNTSATNLAGNGIRLNVVQNGANSNSNTVSGSGHIINVNQRNAGNVATANIGNLTVSGTEHQVFLGQTGENNRATLTISGSSNNTNVSQTGNNNTSSVTQSGGNDIARIVQQGNSNTAGISQPGSNHRAEISQVTSSSQAYITQHISGVPAVATINQTGAGGHYAAVTQR